MPLTDLAVRNAKPTDQLVKFSDGGGLQLWVFPDGAKRWRLAYRAGGSQKLLAIGVYPEVGLKDAREAREAAQRILADGGDPLAVKKHAKAELAIASTNTFEAVAGELIEKKRSEGKADQTISKSEWLLSLAYPEIGARPIGNHGMRHSARASRSRHAWPVKVGQAPACDHRTGLPLRRRDGAR